MTLDQFLLARVGEDEFNWTLAAVRDNPYAVRILAECKAKRRIVSKANTMARMAEERPDDAFPRHAATIYESAMRDLASVYANHKDWREEWRP